MSRAGARWRKWLIIAFVSIAVLIGAAYVGMNVAVDYVLRSFVNEGDVDAILDQAFAEDAWASEGDKLSEGLEGKDSNPDSAATSVSPSHGQTSGGDENPAYTPEVTQEKAEKVKDSISLAEKLAVANVLMKRLDAQDIDLFLKMMSGGMSVEEKREAKSIMLERLTSEEYDELIKIAARYGLSQGKSYEESLKE